MKIQTIETEFSFGTVTKFVRILAIDNCEVLGSCELININTESPSITYLWVDPAHRKKGIATLMFKHIEAYVLEKNKIATAINLSVDKENVDAKRLYEKLGYRTCWSNGSSLSMVKFL